MKNIHDVLAACGFTESDHLSGTLIARSPIDGSEFTKLAESPPEAAQVVPKRSAEAFLQWRNVPAPRRGELVRLWGEELRQIKSDLGFVISFEVGKIVEEGLGEAQEGIDICDFAVGLSRQLHGKTIASERPGHRMMEQYHPLGPVGIISAFNFPSAVFAWNAAIALVCGNPIVFKPSEKATVSGLATFKALERAIEKFGPEAPAGLAQILIGNASFGKALVDSRDIALVSATGSTQMGLAVAQKVAARFGKRILELGGNNAMIVTPSADLSLARHAILFGAVGTTGQRCTTLRRLIVHRSIYTPLLAKLQETYATLRIGNPIEPDHLVGPLIDKQAFEAMTQALTEAVAQGGNILTGGERVLAERYPAAYYVKPALVEMPGQTEVVRRETFAPILYVLAYDTLEEAIQLNNAVPQGLSSSIFSTDMREVEQFLSAAGSDCGIANVNMGPSGAEIGGAFGGEKETGGDRESGSDAWKQYMRRTTNTINYSSSLPLAQGIRFLDS